MLNLPIVVLVPHNERFPATCDGQRGEGDAQAPGPT